MHHASVWMFLSQLISTKPRKSEIPIRHCSSVALVSVWICWRNSPLIFHSTLPSKEWLMGHGGALWMGAGTALLVMVTLLNAVTNELPETSYTKLIDYWFLWHLLLIFCTIVFHVCLGRIQNHMEAPTDDNIITPLPYKHMDAIKLMEQNRMSKTTKINNAAIMIFPILNGIFYAIYFHCTLSGK